MKNGKRKPVIRVENMTAGYAHSVIVEDVSFEVYEGEVFFILGRSGAGKTTVLKQMIGLDRPLEGKVFIGEREITSAEGEERDAILRNLGVMFQSGALFGSMTLIENVRLPMEELTDLPPEAMDLIALMKLHLVGLKGWENRMPSELSGGMQKRGAIARAMALDPAILLLDEPTAGLDPITSAEIDRLILRLAKTLTVTFVVVSHELRSIMAVADRVIILDRDSKRVIASGKPADLKERSDIQVVREFFNPDEVEQRADVAGESREE